MFKLNKFKCSCVFESLVVWLRYVGRKDVYRGGYIYLILK